MAEKERKAKRDASAKATKEARARGELGGLRDLSTEEAAKAGSQSAIAELKAKENALSRDEARALGLTGKPKEKEPKQSPDDGKVVAAASGSGFFVSR